MGGHVLRIVMFRMVTRLLYILRTVVWVMYRSWSNIENCCVFRMIVLQKLIGYENGIFT